MLLGVSYRDGRGDFYGSTTMNAVYSPQGEKLDLLTIIGIETETIARNLPVLASVTFATAP